jgi:outer membrane protein TolC
MKLLGIALAGALASAVSLPAAAAESVLTLEQALQMARRRNRNLVVERARLAQVRTNVEQAWAALFPRVAAEGRYSRNYKQAEISFGPGVPPLVVQPANQLDGAITFSMPLVAPPAYPALQAVKAGVRAAEEDLATFETSLLLTVAQTFYAASVADEVVVARQSNVGVARATLTTAQKRLEAGTVTKVDAGRAELALLRAEQLEREARTARARTYRSLGTLIQATASFRVEAAASRPALPPAQDLEMVLRLRPEFRSLEATWQAAESQKRAHGWRWAPTLSAFGNIRRFNYDNFAFDRHSWVLGAQLDWVLYDGGTRDAQRHLAAAQAAEAQARAQALRDDVRDDLADGREQLDTKQRALETAERSVALARETLALVRIQYQAGSVTQVDLLQAQDALAATQEAQAQARYEVALADLGLRRAAGTFPGP